MDELDQKLGSAVRELRIDVRDLEPPDLDHSTGLARVAVAAAVFVVGFGIYGLFVAARGADTADIVDTANGDRQAVTPDSVEGDADRGSGQDSAELPDLVVPGDASGELVALTEAGSGEFYVPPPFVNAWNASQTRIMLYINGETVRHVSLDLATGDMTTLPIKPADIEQVYWSPTDPDVMFYANSDTADFMALNVVTLEQTLIHSFSDCDRIDSGQGPSAPSNDGLFGLLCHTGASRSSLLYDLATDSIVGKRESDSRNAPQPSPSGQFVVSAESDGSALVLDRELNETGVELDLDYNNFVFVKDDGQEAIAVALYDGPPVGSVVVLPLTGSPGRVVVGPDTGWPYPPSGTYLSSDQKGRIIVSGEGAVGDSDSLSGRVLLVDLKADADDQITELAPHGSGGTVDYWSGPFHSISPTGDRAVISTDDGSDAINTYLFTISEGS